MISKSEIIALKKEGKKIRINVIRYKLLKKVKKRTAGTFNNCKYCQQIITSIHFYLIWLNYTYILSEIFSFSRISASAPKYNTKRHCVLGMTLNCIWWHVSGLKPLGISSTPSSPLLLDPL